MEFVHLVLILGIGMPGASGSATVDSIAFELAPDALWMHADASLSGASAADLRHNIDSAGDGDGVVSANEVSRYAAAKSLHDANDHPDCYTGFTAVRMGGSTPRRLDEATTRFEGATGPTVSKEPVQVHVDAHYLYPPANGVSLVEIHAGDVDASHPVVTCPSTPATAVTFSFGAPSADAPVPPAFRIQAAPGSQLDRGSLRPAEASAFWHGSALRAEAPADRRSLVSTPLAIQVGPDASAQALYPASPGAAPSHVSWVWIGSTAGVGLLLLRLERVRHVLFLGLFTRLDRDRVLDHSTREFLHERIAAEPGLSFSDLRRATELAHGSLRYHLRVLERQGFVRSFREGVRTRYVVRGALPRPTAYVTSAQRELLARIDARPGLTQTALAREVGRPRETVSYHVRRLVIMGRLRVAVHGRRHNYFAADTGAAPT